jgi:hypothetical protein
MTMILLCAMARSASIVVGHPLAGQQVSGGVWFAALALVEHDLNPHATSVRIEPRLGDGGESEAVGWDGNAGLGLTNGVDHQLGAVRAWGEAHGRPARGGWLCDG